MEAPDKGLEMLQNRRRWEKPELKSVGTVGAVLQGGGGKLSVISADPGDTLKPPGQG
jgi:isoaspartyl peptidase/L-asparaginase-like protein (Ntn-hydrolase superfamily)